MLIKVKKWLRLIVRIFVGIILASLAIILIGGMLECPETLAQLVIVGAVAIYLLCFSFKKLMPKSFVSVIKRWSKKLWKKFWKYIF